MSLKKNNNITAEIHTEVTLDKVLRAMWDAGFFQSEYLVKKLTAEDIVQLLTEKRKEILSKNEVWESNGVTELKFLTGWHEVILYNNTNSTAPIIKELFDIIN